MAAALAGCAGGPKTPAKPLQYHRVALIPVASPADVYTENRSFPLPLIPMLIASSIANRGKSAEFRQRIAAERESLGPRFTQILVDALRKEGLEVTVLDQFKRDPEAPDNIDYDALPTKDAVLHVWFSDVSMDSPRTSLDYLPRFNVDAGFYPVRDGSGTHDQYLYYRYGTDASGSEKDAWSIPSDPRYRFADFDTLMARLDDVDRSWVEAMHETARRIARDIRKSEDMTQ